MAIQKKEKTESTGKKPIITARYGNISASVFSNDVQDKTFYNVALQKSYPKKKDNDGNVTEWGNQSISINLGMETMRVMMVLSKIMGEEVTIQE